MVIRKIACAFAALALAAVLAPTGGNAAEVQMTFYGNMHFRFVSNDGKVILINPWIKGNKDATIGMDFYKKGEVDLILTTSGHGDDQGNALEIAAKTGATIFTVAELGSWMQSEIEKFKGSKKQIYRGAIGGRYKVGGVTAQLIQSSHGSGAKSADGSPNPVYGGPASGVLLTFENGLKVLMAGSTGLSMELQLFGMRYQPHIAMLPVMGRWSVLGSRRIATLTRSCSRESPRQSWRDAAWILHTSPQPPTSLGVGSTRTSWFSAAMPTTWWPGATRGGRLGSSASGVSGC